MSYNLRNIVDMAPNAHVIVSAEHAGSSTLINSGGVILKNSDWARNFVQKWWTYQDRRLFSDQVLLLFLLLLLLLLLLLFFFLLLLFLLLLFLLFLLLLLLLLLLLYLLLLLLYLLLLYLLLLLLYLLLYYYLDRATETYTLIATCASLLYPVHT